MSDTTPTQKLAAALFLALAVASFVDGEPVTGCISLGSAVVLVTMWSSSRARIGAAALLVLTIPGTLIGNASGGALARGLVLSIAALGCAVLMVATLPGSRRTRVGLAVGIVAAAVAVLFVVGLIIAAAVQGN